MVETAIHANFHLDITLYRLEQIRWMNKAVIDNVTITVTAIIKYISCISCRLSVLR